MSFRARIGVQRISGSLDSTQAGYTRDIREQMRAIEKNFGKFVQEAEKVTPSVLREALTPTFEKSQKYCPVDTGDLKKSGYLEVRKQGRKIQSEIGYGKGNRPFYAVFVHEMLNYKHKAPTRAKFLQAALQEDAHLISRRIRAAYKRMVKR